MVKPFDRVRWHLIDQTNGWIELLPWSKTLFAVRGAVEESRSYIDFPTLLCNIHKPDQRQITRQAQGKKERISATISRSVYQIHRSTGSTSDGWKKRGFGRSCRKHVPDTPFRTDAMVPRYYQRELCMIASIKQNVDHKMHRRR